MKYKILNENIRLRKEKNNTYSFLNTKSMKIVFLNKIASDIFQHPEITNLDDLSTWIFNKYEAPSIDVVKKDCKELLYKMNWLELIEIDNVIKDKKNKYEIAGEKDYKDISNFIYKCFTSKNKVLMYSSMDMNYYTPYAIRARQFNNKEYNYICYNDDNKIEAVITLGAGTTSSYSILNIFMNNYSSQIVNELLEFVFQSTPLLLKVRISVKTNSDDSKLKRITKDLGFVLEATLKNEYGQGEDLLCYSLFRG